MATVTYLPSVECEVSPGTLPGQEVISIEAVDGRRHFFLMGEGFAETVGGKMYAHVGIVQVDRECRRTLVELPNEADSGAVRLWIPFERFLQAEPEGSAK